MKNRFSWLCLLLAVVMTGCTSFGTGLVKPDVQLAYVVPQTSEGATPSFRVGLRVSNPNRVALDIRGLYFTLRLQEFQVVNGISNQPQRIEPYGEGVIELQANTSLVSTLRTLASLLANPERPLEYRLEARIDTDWWRAPVTLVDSGSIVLGDRTR